MYTYSRFFSLIFILLSQLNSCEGLRIASTSDDFDPSTEQEETVGEGAALRMACTPQIKWESEVADYVDVVHSISADCNRRTMQLPFKDESDVFHENLIKEESCHEYKAFDKEQLLSTLRGRVIFWHGDSTTQNLYDHLVDAVLNVREDLDAYRTKQNKTVGMSNDNEFWAEKEGFQDKSSNITLTWDPTLTHAFPATGAMNVLMFNSMALWSLKWGSDEANFENVVQKHLHDQVHPYVQRFCNHPTLMVFWALTNSISDTKRHQVQSKEMIWQYDKFSKQLNIAELKELQKANCTNIVVLPTYQISKNGERCSDGLHVKSLAKELWQVVANVLSHKMLSG